MTEDEFSRRMEFIVAWQARFDADIEALKQRQERFQVQLEAASARQDRFDGQLQVLTAVANSAIDTSTRAAEVVTMLAEAQVEFQRRVADQFAETDRHITRVARLLEAHVREGHPRDAEPS